MSASREPVEVYCDVGISPASMPSPSSRHLQPTLVGRIVILIPALDFGLVQQVREGILNKKGNPSSNHIEILAVRKAKEICVGRSLANYVILTDILASAETTGVQEARWLEPGRLQLASLFLQRIVNRARYLRQSSRKVITRVQPNEVQRDEFRLFSAESLEFALSKSALWNKIQSEVAAAKGLGQEHLES